MMESVREKSPLKGGIESSQPLLEAGLAKGVSGSAERVSLGSAGNPRGGGSCRDVSAGDEAAANPSAASGPAASVRAKLRTLTCADSFAINMNLLDRDAHHVNDHIDVPLEEVLAEPRSSHSVDGAWRGAFVLFAGTRHWVYRVLSAACALPCGLLWGLLFSLVALLGVWLVAPLMRLIDVLLHVVRRVWGGAVRAVLDPIFQSAGLLFQAKRESQRSSIEVIPPA